MKLSSDLMPFMLDFLDIQSVRFWYEVMALDRSMRPVIPYSSDWFHSLYVDMTRDSKMDNHFLLETLEWFTTLSKRVSVIQMYTGNGDFVDMNEMVQFLLRSPVTAQIKVLKLDFYL